MVNQMEFNVLNKNQLLLFFYHVLIFFFMGMTTMTPPLGSHICITRERFVLRSAIEKILTYIKFNNLETVDLRVLIVFLFDIILQITEKYNFYSSNHYL